MKMLPSTAVVPGDLVLLQDGDVVCADMRIILCKDLRVDEALLTGEAEPVEKELVPLSPPTLETRHV